MQSEMIRKSTDLHSERMPLVSVIIPCYRQAHFLKDSIASLQAQTFQNWEAIIVNDGSPDNTEEVVSQLLITERRIRYVAKQNGGLSSARNAGLEMATGHYLQFLDADDVLLPQKFAADIKLLTTATKAAVSICDYKFFNNTQGEYASDYCTPRFRCNDPVIDMLVRWEINLSIPPHCFLFDRSLFVEAGLKFPEHIPNHEDWTTWALVFAKDPQIFFTEETHALYRKHESSMSANMEAMYHGFIDAIDYLSNVFQSDVKRLEALSFKKKITHAAYERRMIDRFYNLLQKRGVLRNTPWPVQKLLQHTFMLNRGDATDRFFKKMVEKYRLAQIN